MTRPIDPAVPLLMPTLLDMLGRGLWRIEGQREGEQWRFLSIRTVEGDTVIYTASVRSRTLTTPNAWPNRVTRQIGQRQMRRLIAALEGQTEDGRHE